MAGSDAFFRMNLPLGTWDWESYGFSLTRSLFLSLDLEFLFFFPFRLDGSDPRFYSTGWKSLKLSWRHFETGLFVDANIVLVFKFR